MLGTALALILATSSPTLPQQDLAPETPAQIECLARNLYFEARNQGYKGMQAVANVTMNRVNSEKQKDTVCEVVYQKATLPTGKKVCQFSQACNLPKDKQTPKPRSDGDRKALETAYEIATLAVNNELKDIVNGSTHFHDKKIPRFAKWFIKIGDHIFYK